MGMHALQTKGGCEVSEQSSETESKLKSGEAIWRIWGTIMNFKLEDNLIFVLTCFNNKNKVQAVFKKAWN